MPLPTTPLLKQTTLLYIDLAYEIPIPSGTNGIGNKSIALAQPASSFITNYINALILAVKVTGIGKLNEASSQAIDYPQIGLPFGTTIPGAVKFSPIPISFIYNVGDVQIQRLDNSILNGGGTYKRLFVFVLFNTFNSPTNRLIFATNGFIENYNVDDTGAQATFDLVPDGINWGYSY